MKSQRAWAIVYKKTGNLAHIQAELPVYWLREVAEERAKGFSKCEVKSVLVFPESNMKIMEKK